MIAAFFPLFFKQFWSYGLKTTESTFYLGLANSAAGFLLTLCSPLLGAIADRSSHKIKYLATFAFMGAVSTGALFAVSKGEWVWAIVYYVLATLGFNGSLVFYDSLIVKVSTKKTIDFVSSFGFSLGYLGGALLFTLNVFMILKFSAFGFSSAAEATQWAFLSVALWWVIFTIPLLLWVPEEEKEKTPPLHRLVKESFLGVIKTFKEVQRYKPIFIFLVAYFFYIDGVNTTIKMAVDYGLSIGLTSETLIQAILIVNFVAFPATLLFLALTKNLGSKGGILVGLMLYCGIVIGGYFMSEPIHFLWLSMAIGFAQGGVQALSRSHFGKMIPEGRSAEFFGFYNMIGKFSSVLGPILMGWVSLWTGSPRISILSLLFLFLVGGLILTRQKKEVEVTTLN